MKIFAVYVGGTIKNANVELHDMRFAVGATIEDTYADLKNQWWGTPRSLHIDCWGVVESVEDYNVVLKPEPYTGEDKLYFVNLGGYNPSEFTELHKNIFVIAPTESKAKVKALKTVPDWKSGHKDFMFEIENMICLDSVVKDKGLHIHLEKTAHSKPFEFICKYQPIGKTA
jgi:hypothetical protein